MEKKCYSIAVVDDDDLFRRTTSNVLERKMQQDVLSFESGEEAFDHLEKLNGIDVILSDINMPGMNGLEFLEKVKQKYPQKICILMSGYPGNEQTAIKRGADGYISKPFSMRKLSDLMETLDIQ
ncbi:MAG: response regulator [Thermodesulfobacteriota bacterium]|nr:response regulator [Thermodesulfobacteriota bacterium]